MFVVAVHICCCYSERGSGKRGGEGSQCGMCVFTSAGLIWQRRNLLLARATWNGPTVIGSMSYLHIKYRNPCKVPSHKQISLSFTRAVAVCMCVCVFLYSPWARKCCQVDCFYECIAYFAAPQGRPWVQLRLAYRANSLCTLIAAGKLEVLAELATVRGAACLPVCLAA